MRAVTACVDYDDYLALVLPSWLPLFREIVVVTSPADERTQTLVERQDGVKVKLHVTDAFYRNGDVFNKGSALSEGLAAMEMHGWIAIMDADIVLPKSMQEFEPWVGCLYSPYRRMAPMCLAVPPENEWRQLPLGDEAINREFAGYCQIFHRHDPTAPQSPPFYPTNWSTARGCDTDFWRRWSPDRLIRPDWEVLHLGDSRKNWNGRTTPRLWECEDGFF